MPKSKIVVERISINQAGYDRHGRYFGVAGALYHVDEPSTGVDSTIRARNAREARNKFETDPDVSRRRRKAMEKDPLGF